MCTNLYGGVSMCDPQVEVRLQLESWWSSSVDPGKWSQVVRRGDSYLYPPSHLNSHYNHFTKIPQIAI